VEARTGGVTEREAPEQRKLTQEQLAFEAEIDLTYMGELSGESEIPAYW
jgi:hypothetical protein